MADMNTPPTTPRMNLMGLIKKEMKYSTERAAVLAQNIANKDTPGFEARELAKPNFKTLMQPVLHMSQTSPLHMRGNGEKGAFKSYKSPDTYETTLDGNTVVVEEQMFKIAENNTNYQGVTNIYKKMLNMLRISIRGTGGA